MRPPQVAALQHEGGLLMDAGVMFIDCPAYMDQHGAVRCGLPAEIEYRYTMTATDGPLESAKIRCPRGHGFNGPVESLTWRDPESTVQGKAVTRTETKASRPPAP